MLIVKKSKVTKKKATADSRRKKLMRRKVMLISLVVSVITIPLAGWLIWDSYGKAISGFAHRQLDDIVLFISDAAGLTLKNIYVEGQKFTNTKAITETIDLTRERPILAIALSKIKADLEKLKWVDTVNIERQIPDTLHIRIIEKQPIAIWQHKGTLALIDRGGEVISNDFLSYFKDLPIVVGKNAKQHTGELFAILATEPELLSRVSAAIWVGDRRWNIRLVNGIEILLPQANVLEAWEQLAKLEREKQLFKRNIKSIDLRVKNKMFIKTR